MDRETKQQLLTRISQEIERKSVSNQENKTDLRDMRDATRSQKGDRLLMMTQSELSERSLNSLKNLAAELEAANDNPCEQVVPPSRVELKFDDDGVEDIIFVNNSATLTGYNFVTPQSPLGQAIKDKKPRQTFSYQVREGLPPISGSILGVK